MTNPRRYTHPSTDILYVAVIFKWHTNNQLPSPYISPAASVNSHRWSPPVLCNVSTSCSKRCLIFQGMRSWRVRYSCLVTTPWPKSKRLATMSEKKHRLCSSGGSNSFIFFSKTSMTKTATTRTRYKTEACRLLLVEGLDLVLLHSINFLLTG